MSKEVILCWRLTCDRLTRGGGRRPIRGGARSRGCSLPRSRRTPDREGRFPAKAAGKRPVWVAIVGLGLIASGQLPVHAQGGGGRPFLDTLNESGVVRTVTLDGRLLETTSAFFNTFGTNGRTCFSCHVPSAGWSIVPYDVREAVRGDEGPRPDLPGRRWFELPDCRRLDRQGTPGGVQHAPQERRDTDRPSDPT